MYIAREKPQIILNYTQGYYENDNKKQYFQMAKCARNEQSEDFIVSTLAVSMKA